MKDFWENVPGTGKSVSSSTEGWPLFSLFILFFFHLDLNIPVLFKKSIQISVHCGPANADQLERQNDQYSPYVTDVSFLLLSHVSIILLDG